MGGSCYALSHPTPSKPKALFSTCWLPNLSFLCTNYSPKESREMHMRSGLSFRKPPGGRSQRQWNSHLTFPWCVWGGNTYKNYDDFNLFKVRFLLIENTDLDIKPPVCYPIPHTNRSGIGISNLTDRSIGFIFAK